MLLLIIALLISSTIVLLFEEYVEDSELEASRQLRQNGKLVVEKETPGKVSICLQHGIILVVTSQ